MKISELIDSLNLFKKYHGDIPVQAVDILNTKSFWKKDYDNIHEIRFDLTTNSIIIEA